MIDQANSHEATLSEREPISVPSTSLHKSTSVGNLSRFTATTAEGTDSLSTGRADHEEAPDHRLTVFQLDSWSESKVSDERNRCGAAPPASTFSGDEDISKSVLSKSSSIVSAERSAPALPAGIPSEVLVIRDHSETSVRGAFVWSDSPETEDNRLDLYQKLLASYREKMQSTSEENDTLHEFLRQTQSYAEDLLNQREELIQAMEELEEDVSQRNDQELLLKVIMLFSLLMYLSGGSPEFLVASVGLQLFATLVNLLT